MCGRFSLAVAPEVLMQHFGLPAAAQERAAVPRYNIAPSQPVLAVVAGSLQRKATHFRWGLIPAWSQAAKAGLINARSETVAEKPSFREAFRRRRCLIPADGFYEWADQVQARRADNPTGFTCWIDRYLPLPGFGNAGAVQRGWRWKPVPSSTPLPTA